MKILVDKVDFRYWWEKFIERGTVCVPKKRHIRANGRLSDDANRDTTKLYKGYL